MKKNRLMIKYILALCLTVSLVLPSRTAICAAPETGEKADEAADDENTVRIGNVADFLEFVQNCQYDRWSIGKTVILTSDLDLSSLDFGGIGYFNGTFEGNGYKIVHVSLSPKGSDFGFFRYIGEKGVVKGLHISGRIVPSGSQENIGGLTGVNYGTVSECSFEGSVSGKEAVGAIAGINKGTGQIIACESSAVVLATNCTGGIAGNNEGVISGCNSKSNINMEELETILDLGGVDLGSLNLTQNMVNRNDMGGIAGYSTGVITDCTNEGTVGYIHAGYNVGGIAGRQSGMVLTSVNEGQIYGRKDVGGIVGQAEPYIESEYLKDKAAETRQDIQRLNNTLSSISSTISNTSANARNYAESLSSQYTESLDSVSGSLDSLSESIAADHPEAQGYVNNINSAMDSIHSIEASGGKLTNEQVEVMQSNLGIINDNLGSLQGTLSNTGDSAEELVSSISDELSKNNRQQNIKNMADTIDQGVQSVAKSISSAANQLNHIAGSIGDDLAVLTGEEEYIQDISSIETAENTDGVISGCVNRGMVNGDLNAGGITGTMNIEYEGNPEFDFDLTGSLNITLRSTVNNVVIHSINYGSVTTKKNCAGGIAGLQELGFLYDCEGYGTIQSDSGSYLGGVAGRSDAALRGCYSLCNISGEDYVGGICGSGYSVEESISICSIDSDGERRGSIAGMLEEEGTVKNNYFVYDDLNGIDNISYSGIADPVTYEDVMEMETVPEGFVKVTVTFLAGDEILAEKTVAYGGSITEAEFPSAPEKENCYVAWNAQENLKEIQKNLTVTAEYIPWEESVAGNKKSKNGNSLFLTEGDFYADTKLLMEETEGPEKLEENAVLQYAYTWELSSVEGKTYESLTGHFYVPSTEGKAQLWLLRDGEWNKTETKTDGSYLVADIPYGAAFAVMILPEDYAVYFLIAVGAGIAILVFLFIRRHNKKKTKKEVQL